MLDTPRGEKLGELYDSACEKLSEGSVAPDAGEITPAVVELSIALLSHYTGIIDRYLAQQELDRQYELKRELADAQAQRIKQSALSKSERRGGTGVSNAAGKIDPYPEKDSYFCPVTDCLKEEGHEGIHRDYV